MATVTLTSTSFSRQNQRFSLHVRHPELDKIKETASSIALYYIPYHLRNCVKHELLRGLPKQYLIPPRQPHELFVFVAKLCTQMEEENSSFFNGLPDRVKLKSESSRTIFLSLCHEIFADKVINWGRIISVFTLAGSLAAYFAKKGQVQLIPKIPHWIEEFVDQELAGWINSQGGWDDLVNRLSNKDSVHTWSAALAIGGVMAAAGYVLFSSGLGR